MSKSKGNIIILNTLIEKGFNPLTYRYLTLNAHYRSQLTFSWEAIENAQNSLESLYEKIVAIKPMGRKTNKKSKEGEDYKINFLEAINNDLDMPKALAIAWQLIKDEKVPNNEKYRILLNFDKVFGLELDKIKKARIPKKVKNLAKKREKYRQEKNWGKADELRKKAEKWGYLIKDTDEGPKIKKL